MPNGKNQPSFDQFFEETWNKLLTETGRGVPAVSQQRYLYVPVQFTKPKQEKGSAWSRFWQAFTGKVKESPLESPLLRRMAEISALPEEYYFKPMAQEALFPTFKPQEYTGYLTKRRSEVADILGISPEDVDKLTPGGLAAGIPMYGITSPGKGKPTPFLPGGELREIYDKPETFPKYVRGATELAMALPYYYLGAQAFGATAPGRAVNRALSRGIRAGQQRFTNWAAERAFRRWTPYKEFLNVKTTLPMRDQLLLEGNLRTAFRYLRTKGQEATGRAILAGIVDTYPEIVPELRTQIPEVFTRTISPGLAGGIATMTKDSWGVLKEAEQILILKSLGFPESLAGTAWKNLPTTARLALTGIIASGTEIATKVGEAPEAPPLVKPSLPIPGNLEIIEAFEKAFGVKPNLSDVQAIKRYLREGKTLDEALELLGGALAGQKRRVPGEPPPGVPLGVLGEVPEELTPATIKGELSPEEREAVLRDARRALKLEETAEMPEISDIRAIELALAQNLLVDQGGMDEIPPYIREGRQPTVGDLSDLKIGEKTPLELITSQEYYTKKLGAGPLLAPLFMATGEQTKIYQIMERIISKKVAKLSKTAQTNMRDWLNTYEEPPEELAGKDREAFLWFRNLTRTMINAENQVRVLLGEEPITYREAYIRNIAIGSATEIILDPKLIPEDFPDRAVWQNRIVSPKVWNPMEFQRIEQELAEALGIIYSKDLKYSLTSMVRIALKEIFLTEPINAFNQMLSELGTAVPARTKEYLKTLINVSIKGQQTGFDEEAEAVFKKSGLAGIINKYLAALGKPAMTRPLAQLSRMMGRLVISGALGPRPDILIRNLFQKTQDLGLHGVMATLKAALPMSKHCRGLVQRSLYFALYHGFEELPIEMQRKLERAWLGLYGRTAVFNALGGMKAAYHHYNPYFESQKGKELGFWSPRRLRAEELGIDLPKGFRFPEEDELLLMLMEYDSGVTQYVYSVLGMPGIYRHKTAAAVLRLQSWWMNYFAKFWGEMLHRLTSRQIGYDWGDITIRPLVPGRTPGVPPEPPDDWKPIMIAPEGGEVWRPNLKASWRERYAIILYAILGGGILTAMGYKRSFMFGVLPGRFSPTANVLMGMYNYTAADTESQREEALRQMFEGWQIHIPGHLTYEEFKRAFTGDQSWARVFFYTREGWPPGIPTLGLPPGEAIETIRQAEDKLGTALPIEEEGQPAEIYQLADARRDINAAVGQWGLFVWPASRLGGERLDFAEFIRDANDWIGRYEKIPGNLRTDFRRQHTHEAAMAEAYLFMMGSITKLQCPYGEGYYSWQIVQQLKEQYDIPDAAIPNYTIESARRAPAETPPATPSEPEPLDWFEKTWRDLGGG